MLRFADIEIRLGLTYLHHLSNCQGWGDLDTIYRSADETMADGIGQIERAMWRQIDKQEGGE